MGLKDVFKKIGIALGLFIDKGRYTEWKLVQGNVSGKILVNGKEEFRRLDIYERFDNFNQVYEHKRVYVEPTKVVVGIYDSLSPNYKKKTKK